MRFPLNVKGAEVLLVTPSADFFSEPHVESLIGYAKVFHAAGISWTLSSHASEAGNFGLFIGNYEQMRNISLRVREAALELGVKRIIVGECGHAWRVAYSFWNTLIGPFDYLDPRYPVPQHICESTYDLIQQGALKFDKEKNDDRIITFHDSCNVARASRMGSMPGGQFVIPREIIKSVANHFHDMAAGTIHDATFCCGGGGGLLTDDLLELRVKGALPRMEALKHVVDDHGVNFMATICAICKAQFSKVLPYYGFDMSMVGGVHQLVLARKIIDYARTPAPLKIPTTPAPLTTTDVGLRMTRELVFFESLFRSSKWTSIFGWAFHVALLLVLLRHLRYFQEPVWLPVLWIQPFGLYAGFAMVGALAGLWARRFLVDRVRYISTPSDHLMLALLGAIGLTGLAMRFVAHTDIVAVKAFMLGLMRFDLQPLPAPPGAAAAPGPGGAADDRLPDQQAAARAGPVLQPDAQPGRHLARGAACGFLGRGAGQEQG